MRGGASGGPSSALSSSSSTFSAQANAALAGLSNRLESTLASLGLRLPVGGSRSSSSSERGEAGDDPLEPFLGELVVCVCVCAGGMAGGREAFRQRMLSWVGVVQKVSGHEQGHVSK